MDSIIFDLDGTLWDSTHVVADAWNEVLQEKCNKALTSADLKKLFGKTLDHIASIVFSDFPQEQQMELIEQCCAREHLFLQENPPAPYAGVEETLAALSSRYPLFIVSNCQAGYIELFLSITNLGRYITGHLCPGDTNKAKAYNIAQVVKQHSLQSPVYVGDTKGDQQASLEASVPFIFASYGFDDVKDSDYTIQKPEDLLELF